MEYSKEQIVEALNLVNIADINFKEHLLLALNDISQGNTLSHLLKGVCELTGVTEEQVKSKSKKLEYTKVRAVFCLIAMERFPYMKERAIAPFINKDHATLNYYKKIFEYDTLIINFYDFIKSNLF